MTNVVTLSVTRFYYDGDGTRTKQVESKGGTTITTAYARAIEVTITGTQRITQAYYMAGAHTHRRSVVNTACLSDQIVNALSDQPGHSTLASSRPNTKATLVEWPL